MIDWSAVEILKCGECGKVTPEDCAAKCKLCTLTEEELGGLECYGLIPCICEKCAMLHVDEGHEIVILQEELAKKRKKEADEDIEKMIEEVKEKSQLRVAMARKFIADQERLEKKIANRVNAVKQMSTPSPFSSEALKGVKKYLFEWKKILEESDFSA